jgi:hypothetical protein
LALGPRLPGGSDKHLRMCQENQAWLKIVCPRTLARHRGASLLLRIAAELASSLAVVCLRRLLIRGQRGVTLNERHPPGV